ncbi:aldo-keto reductase [Ordospora colligata]|uniref:Aldo-keto reductase n=1 Tax=Ordospora colligata OC4 TaxID=1354746 RepID=A0A0B2UMD2_9MICR|nr:aldo-keto reductase [Ordospora colligata OC4]KHN70434.1 aldo-keto reductase [Ordospora colligata OC4]TBU17184.1 aldo-keto reductase [Ordospora colligata]TBU17434.1 aldo-keto reductase [Ordospora colligata]TBU19614.1 aldo-keto reductase [Ordospora colligata]
MILPAQKLSNGEHIPTIGLGTWGLVDPGVLECSIRNAIELGYRHIDTAHIYGNQKKIGQILKNIFSEGLVERKDLFITSKLWNDSHDDPMTAIKQTLEDLQLEYVDLYLIHWPVRFEPDANGEVTLGLDRFRLGAFDPVPLWKKMEELVDAGYTRSIGISNFGIENTKKVLEVCRIKPVVSQFELHPYLKQTTLVNFLHEHDIHIVSYSSLGSTADCSLKIRNDKTIKTVAEKYECSPSQIILSYLTMQGVCVIPKSTSRKHLEENMDLKALKQEDMRIIDGIEITHRYVDPISFGESRFD